jgi:hypothetical protein
VSVDGPELGLEFLPRDQLSGALQQHAQDAKRLLLQSDSSALFIQFTRAYIDLELTGEDATADATFDTPIPGHGPPSEFPHFLMNEL